MIPAALLFVYLGGWYLIHRCYKADQANAQAVHDARIEDIKTDALEATAIAMSAVDKATEVAQSAILDVEWARIVIAEQQGELDRINSRYLVLPTLAGVRAEAADGVELRPAGGVA